MFNFCTMFNVTYLTRGIALYESLEKHCSSNFHLYVIAFDVHSYEVLAQLSYKNMTIIKRSDFECKKLLEVKDERSTAEYFWTCTPFAIDYCISKFNLPSCTYLDADIYFYHSPSILFSELAATDSVLITEHRYTPIYDQTKISGKYCVQFMYFKNDKNGLFVLNWWMDRCFEWCYARSENGKFGDQKYLDNWPDKFAGICDLKHHGGGAAPWNIQQYSLNASGQKILISAPHLNNTYQLVFYHFHGFRYLTKSILDLGFYELSKDVKNFIYRPYIDHLDSISRELEDRNLNRLTKIKSPSQSFWRELKKIYRHRKNILTLNTI